MLQDDVLFSNLTVRETFEFAARMRLPAGGLVAVAGAPAVVRVGGEEVPFGEAFEVGPGMVVEVGPATVGVRSYVAFAGGVDAERLLGSRSTDLLTGLGPKPLASTVSVPLGRVPAGDRPASGPKPILPDVRSDTLLRVIAGPRDDRFAGGALDSLEVAHWTVSPRSNRIGVRLEGAALPALEGSGALRSEGMVTGSIQVPPGGLPTLMLNDRPTTGGYPVIAVVVEDDLRLAGQLRPGSRVRFTVG